MKISQNNILIFRIALIFIGIIVLIVFLHLNSKTDYDFKSEITAEQRDIAEELAQKYNAAVLQHKIKQQELINKIIPFKNIVAADSVVKDFYQKGKDVFIIIKINNSSKNIYAKLKCSSSVINEYFKLKSNRVFAVFEPKQILYSQPFYELESLRGEPVIIHGKDEILIAGNCLKLVDYPTFFVDG